MIYKEFVPKEGQVMANTSYKHCNFVSKKQACEPRTECWRLLRYDAPCHTAINLRTYIYENEVTVLSNPTYSPDMVSPDLFLFPGLKLNVLLKASLSVGLKVSVNAVISVFSPSWAVLR